MIHGEDHQKAAYGRAENTVAQAARGGAVLAKSAEHTVESAGHIAQDRLQRAYGLVAHAQSIKDALYGPEPEGPAIGTSASRLGIGEQLVRVGGRLGDIHRSLAEMDEPLTRLSYLLGEIGRGIEA